MRLLELRLSACGPFTDLALDLGGGRQGLHIIYGHNEAGKSSALRALKHLFFGFDVQTSDNFLHAYDRLRVGARIRGDNGQELDFIRRKANKHSLRGSDDNTVLDEERLRAFLGHVDEQRFTTFFGIDHAALVRGGKEIMAEKGDVGQVLFSAGGIANLRPILEAFEEESRELFVPSARKPKLNAWLLELADKRKEIKEHQLPAREWEERFEGLQKLLKQKDDTQRRWTELTAEKGRLERFTKAVPLAAELLEARDRLAAVANAVLLPDDFSDQRREVQEQTRLQETVSGNAQAAIAQFHSELENIEVSPAVLAAGDDIEKIRNDLGAVRKAAKDSPDLAAQVRQHRQTVSCMLRELGANLEVERAEELRIPEAQRVRIQELGGLHESRVVDVEESARLAAEATLKWDQRREELARLPAPRDTEKLQRVCEETLRQGDLEADLDSLGQRLVERERQLEFDAKRLGLCSEIPAEIASLHVPPPDVVDRFDAELADLEGQRRRLSQKIDELQDESEEAQRKLDALRLEQDVPSEEDLRLARELRQRGWKLVKARLRQENVVVGELQALIQETGGDELDDAFEQAVARADELADRLRREAERVQQRANLQTQLEKLAKRLAKETQRRDEAAEAQTQKMEEWQQAWSACGIRPLPPREMRAWSKQQRDILVQWQDVSESRDQSATLESRIVEYRARLTGVLLELGENPAELKDHSLSELLAQAQRLQKKLDAAAQHYRAWEVEANRLENEHRKALDKAQRAKQKLAGWQNDWNIATAGVPVFLQGAPGQATQVLERLHALTRELDEIQTKDARIEGMRLEGEQFTRHVHEVCARVAADLAGENAERASETLLARHQNAQTNDAQRKQIQKQLTGEEKSLKKAQDEWGRCQARLQTLCAQAQCESPDDLLGAERQSGERQRLDQLVVRLEKELRELAAGQTLDEFLAEVRACRPDELPPAIKQLQQEIQDRAAELDRLGPEIGQQREKLAAMDCSAKAADAAEQARDLEKRIREGAEEYARLRLALSTLRKGIDRIRQQHQGPILQRAGMFFSRLTAGSFSGLAEDYNEKGEPELVGKRSGNGQVIHVTDMSDGTADQLYLAVRLAWLQEYVEQHESAPFIVDDILICCDDDRAAAALATLAELSRQTQVIFFTHHKHLVDLARRELDEETLFVQELPAVESSGTAKPLAVAT